MPSTEKQMQETELPKTLLQDLVKTGYFVGILNDGNLVFEVIGGEEKTLIELLGLHKHAQEKIQLIYDAKNARGDALTIAAGDLLAEVNKKLDHIISMWTVKSHDMDGKPNKNDE